MDYDQSAFIAGYKVGRALKAWDVRRTPLKGVKQCTLQGFAVVWDSPYRLTITWTKDDDPDYDRGIVLAPNLFPLKVTATATNGAKLQYGVCTIAGYLPDIIHTGHNRVWYNDSTLPDGVIITDDTHSMRSFYIGEVFGPPVGTEFSVTIEW